MSRLDKLVGAFRGAVVKGGAWDSVFLRNLEFNLDGGIAKRPYSKSELVYVCISTTARAISQAPLIVMKKVGGPARDQNQRVRFKVQRDGSYNLAVGRDRKRIVKLLSIPKGMETKDEVWEPAEESDPWQQLFYKPNSLNDSKMFIEAIIGHWMLDGNIWVLPWVPSKKGVPEALWFITQQYMKTIIDKRNNQLMGWRYSPQEQKGWDLLFDEVRLAHMKFWNPYDPYLGQKPLEAGKLPLMTDWKAAKFNEKFFDEGAEVGGVVSTEQKLGDAQYNRLTNQIENRHKGYLKSHRIMLLEQNLQYKQTGLSHKDMRFIDLRRFNRDTIFQIFGMKKAVVSVTDDLNYATAKDQTRQWWESTNLPLMKGIESGLNDGVLEGEDNVWVTFDLSNVSALKEDFSDKVAVAKDLTAIGFTANEVNEKLELGFDEKPWRNKWYMPSNVTPIGEGDDLAPPPSPDDDDPAGDDGDEGSDADDGSTPPATPTGEHPPTPAPAPSPSPESVTPSRAGMDDWDVKAGTAWKDFVRETASIEERFEKKTRRVFYDMRKRSLALFLKGVENQETKAKKSADDIDKENFDIERKLIEKFADPLYEESLKVGAASAADAGIAFDLTDPLVDNFLKQKVSKVSGVVDTVKRQMMRQIQQGYSSGETVRQIADRIRSVFNMADGRARTIARTEVLGAANFGRTVQIDSSGFQQKRWFTALDERVRQTHGNMHGKTIKKGEMWQLPGGSVRYPGDSSGPAAEVINCRCIEVVVEESLGMGGGDLYSPEILTDSAPLAEQIGVSKNRIASMIEACYIPDKDFDGGGEEKARKGDAEAYKRCVRENITSLERARLGLKGERLVAKMTKGQVIMEEMNGQRNNPIDVYSRKGGFEVKTYHIESKELKMSPKAKTRKAKYSWCKENKKEPGSYFVVPYNAGKTVDEKFADVYFRPNFGKWRIANMEYMGRYNFSDGKKFGEYVGKPERHAVQIHKEFKKTGVVDVLGEEEAE